MGTSTTMATLPSAPDRRTVERAELERFKQLLDEHHYLGGPQSGGPTPPLRGYRCPGSVAGVAGLQRSSQAPQASRPMDRLECCTTPPSPESGDQQQSLPDPARALCAQPGEQGVAPDPGSASHRVAELLRPSGVGDRNFRRCWPILRYGLFGQRLERTWPDRRLGPPSARLLC